MILVILEAPIVLGISEELLGWRNLSEPYLWLLPQRCRAGVSGPKIHASMREEIACVNTCAYTYIQKCMHTYVANYIHTCIHTCIHKYKHTYMHACIHTYTHTDSTYIPYIYTYIHTYMHTYIHTLHDFTLHFIALLCITLH